MTQNSTIQWQTGIPKRFGKYLITTKYNEVDVDIWYGVPDSNGDHWKSHYDENVIAWCFIEDVKPFKI